VTDVQIFQSQDDGDIRLSNGQVVTDDGLSSAFYLSLFGGNDDDDGTEATLAKQWWGNLIEGEPTRRYRSRTQAVLRGLPATTANLRKVEAAANEDLAWATATGLATFVGARARMPALRTVQLDVFAEIDGEIVPFQFPPIPWGPQ